jgi:hypothetical protein
MPISQINTNSIANDAVVTADILDGAITNAKIAAMAASKLTGTVPLANGGSGTTVGQAIIPLSIVQPAGSASFGFSVTAYRQYIIFYQNVSFSNNSTVMAMKVSSDGGSTFSSQINTTNARWFVDGTSSQSGSTTNVGTGFIWNDTWNSGTNGTNGVICIGGTPYGGVNRRLSWWAIGGGQTAGSQGIQIAMGQTQNDSTQYNYVAIQPNAGTFNNTSTFIICGVRES